MTGTTCTNIQIILDKMQMKQQFFFYIRVRIQGFISCVKSTFVIIQENTFN